MFINLLVLQAILLVVSIGFLFWARGVISRGVWWSFLVRDVLWLAVTIVQFEALRAIPEAVGILLEFAIVCLLTYAIIARWKLQRDYILLRRKHHYTIQELESMRTAEGW